MINRTKVAPAFNGFKLLFNIKMKKVMVSYYYFFLNIKFNRIKFIFY